MDEQYSTATELIARFHSEGIPYQEIAVLVSYNNQIKELYTECTSQGIPAYTARQDFRNTDPILWLQNCACWLQDKSAASFDDICSVWKGFLSLKTSSAIDENEYLGIKRNLIRILTASNVHKDSLYEWLRFLFTELNICQLLSGSDRFPDEIENFKKLVLIAKETEPPLTIDFMARLGVPDNQVVLSTRHSAKGLEFDVVIMLGMEKDSFPSYYATTARQIEEARRLCFVAVSRARKACVLVRSKQLPNKYGRWFSKEPSPFWITLMGFRDERSGGPCR
jgi:DNA helicase II / ATP-dependent DNA helicase PcrA